MEKQKPLFPSSQFKNLYNAMRVLADKFRADVELSTDTDKQEEELKSKGVHVLYREPTIQSDSKANEALLYLLENKHKDPIAERMFEYLFAGLLSRELEPLTAFELFCWWQRNMATYKDEVKTEGELAEMFKEYSFAVKREMQKLTEKINNMLGY